MFSNLA
jgi:hypothetical protein